MQQHVTSTLFLASPLALNDIRSKIFHPYFKAVTEFYKGVNINLTVLHASFTYFI